MMDTPTHMRHHLAWAFLLYHYVYMWHIAVLTDLKHNHQLTTNDCPSSDTSFCCDNSFRAAQEAPARSRRQAQQGSSDRGQRRECVGMVATEHEHACANSTALRPHAKQCYDILPMAPLDVAACGQSMHQCRLEVLAAAAAACPRQQQLLLQQIKEQLKLSWLNALCMSQHHRHAC
jgi:hypothetical protein